MGRPLPRWCKRACLRRGRRFSGRWLLCALVFFIGCAPSQEAETVVFLTRPSQLVALDGRQGDERWRADLPPEPVCDVAPSPDGRWVAVLQRRLIVLSIDRPGEMITVDPPPGWFFPNCIEAYGRVDSPGVLLSWADARDILVMVRTSTAGQEVRGIAAFDIEAKALRPWVQQVARGCRLLAQPTGDVQLACERLRFGRWPVGFSGLLGIDPTNGVIRRWITLSLPQRFIALGVPEVSPVVGVAEGGERQYVLAESGVLFILDGSGYVVESLLIWQEAELESRASGKALRLDRDGTVIWVTLWRNDAAAVLALVELRSLTVARTLVFDEHLVDLDFLDDRSVILLVNDGAVRRLLRRELRSGATRELEVLPRDATCCWVGPLARGE